MLNLFYAEPDPDRWVRFDRYPRAVVRRLVRGRSRPGGHARVFLNLRAGLDKLGIQYRVNDFAHARRNPDELVCIIGKPHLLDVMPWLNPIVFGAAVHSHPLDDPSLLRRLDVRKVLVPGEWMRQMCEGFYGDRVVAWPVGIDTALWAPDENVKKDIDILIYDKVRWDRDRYHTELLVPIVEQISLHGLSMQTIKYGEYREADYHALVKRSKAMVFICEHETQGIAYQQALAADVPLLAWDRGGVWRDPSYYPEKVAFGPVTSVPYWDSRCGAVFQNANEFNVKFCEFWEAVHHGRFMPRSYILDNLTLEQCACKYVELVRHENRTC